MALFKKVNQVLASLGNSKAIDRLELAPEIEEELHKLYGGKIATSEEGILYGGIDDLNDYLFFEAIILSKINLKTFKGATLHFKGKADFVLNSDTQEITSDFSKVTNMFMTNVSFDITQEEIDLIKEQQYDTVVLTIKKKTVTLYRPE